MLAAIFLIINVLQMESVAIMKCGVQRLTLVHATILELIKVIAE
jgi:hypothetical protein